MKKVFIDISGQTFNRLTVLNRSANKGKRAYWLCRCECGALRVVSGKDLRGGHTKSCGCAQTDSLRARATHNQSRTRLYSVWCGIVSRCCNQSDPAFKNYGARGIKISEEWRNSFDAFRNYLGAKPSNAHSVDRIENDGNYEPGNVRWATRREQQLNTRRNRVITFGGVKAPLSEWASWAGLTYGQLHTRIKLGWDFSTALTTPLLHRATERGCGKCLPGQAKLFEDKL